MAAVRINLMPDVRQAKVRAMHQKQLATSIGALVVVVSIGAVVLQLGAIGAQKISISVLNGQISSRTQQLQSINDLPAALTAQQALAALPGLYSQRTYFSNFFAVVAQQTPGAMSFNNVSDDGTGTIKVQGTATDYASIGRFMQALEQAKSSDGTNYFSNVTLTSASTGDTGTVSFALTVTAASSATAAPGGSSNGQ